MNATAKPSDTADREIVISRTFDAPQELVFEAWTNPQHVVKWWGPRGFTTTIEKMEVRPGGVWQLTMHGPDGTNYPNKSVFTEVVRPERIRFTHGGGREDGKGVSFESTWTFENVGGKTKVTIHMVFPTAAARDQVVKEYHAIEGGKQCLERLGEQLAEMAGGAAAPQPFVIARTFDAPRDLVWKAWTERDHLMKWFGPKGCTISTAKLDFRPGGMFHYAMKMPDGKEMWGKFVYREIVPPEKIVLVNSFSDAQGGITRHPMSATWPREMLSTSLFTEHDRKTTITLTWIPLNATAEEWATFNAAHGGMQQGWTGTFEQLEEYLAKAQG
jgi:uncharacterized protein YndB with AHSA1/START domain